MKHTLPLTLAALLSVPASAALPPQQTRTLYEHMLEVNVQWETMDPALARNTTPVHFNNEAGRIAMHLHLVAERLRERIPGGIPPEALTWRSALLKQLDAYADRGVFPRNEVLPYRNPVFIDPYGTACAVGQLMIESGRRDLAEDISRTMNLAYVKEMHRPDVLEWAVEHGFTENELAWIQPGYPPPISWAPVAGGTNGPVKVVLNLDNGLVLVAGDFTEAGGVPMQHVALTDGISYFPLDAGVSGTITCAAAMGEDLYVGGSNINGFYDLAHWDGTHWSYDAVFEGKFPQVFALHVHAGTLYAAGEIQGFVGANERVAMLQDGTWSFLPGDFNEPVASLGSLNGQLVAGGMFTSVTVDDDNVPASHVAAFTNGTWAQLGDGLDAPVLCMASDGNTLYAGGPLYENIVPRFGLARIGPGEAQWQPLMPNLQGYMQDQPGPDEVRTIIAGIGPLFIGGSFRMVMTMLDGAGLAQFTGTPDGFIPVADFNAPVNAVAYNNNIPDAFGLIAGGEFTVNINDTVPYLGEALLGMGVRAPQSQGAVLLGPNPATDVLHVHLGEGIHGNVQVVDAQGKVVLSFQATRRTATLDVSGLAAGTYLLQVQGGVRTKAVPFIKR